jgi:hypothetical protein
VATDSLISTCLAIDQGSEGIGYPQVGAVSRAELEALYWGCVAVFFASSIRFNPNAGHRLILNRIPADAGEAHPLTLIRRLGVEVVEIPFTYAPPDGYHPQFRNAYFSLDAIENVAAAGGDRPVFMLDPDIIWLRSADDFAAAVERHGALTLEIPYPPDQDVNGLTPMELQGLYGEMLAREWPEPARQFGGEVFAATPAEARRIAEVVRATWHQSMDRFARGKRKFNTEEHMTSYAYNVLGYAPGSANDYIRRIWTRRFGTVNASQEDRSLTAWHVPAEKRYGLRRLYRDAVDPSSRFWNTPLDESWIDYVGFHLGVPRAGARKALADHRTDAARKFRRRS